MTCVKSLWSSYGVISPEAWKRPPAARKWPPRPRSQLHCLLLAAPEVELEEDDVAIVDHIHLALLAVLALELDLSLGPQLPKSLESHNLSADEALLEVGVDRPGSLGGLGAAAAYPPAHLVRPRREEVDEVHHVEAGLDDLGEARHDLVVLLVSRGLVLSHGLQLEFKLARERDHGPAAVRLHPVVDGLEVLVLLALVVRLREVDEVQDGLGREE
mmetsp:Transcript_53991/g.128300  ORF Transcript_53991/g.128300 Transcript_53991/m.128300 type:complete len:215 (+) Transcript_53991:360-1004(+)